MGARSEGWWGGGVIACLVQVEGVGGFSQYLTADHISRTLNS